MGLENYGSYLRHDTRDDKYLREEHLPLLAVIDFKLIPDTNMIEIGNEKEPWDACINGSDIYEIVQALPAKEFEVRRAIASGGQSPAMYFQHAADHLQFPRVIIDMIAKKQRKEYSDNRSLVIVFGGDYSGEDDDVIEGWIREVRRETTRGDFKEILLVELDRMRVFTLFPPDN